MNERSSYIIPVVRLYQVYRWTHPTNHPPHPVRLTRLPAILGRTTDRIVTGEYFFRVNTRRLLHPETILALALSDEYRYDSPPATTPTPPGWFP